MSYAGGMRYPDGGGLTAEGRAKREAVRLEAAELFDQDVSTREIAERLRVTTKSVNLWRRMRRAGGDAALASKGPGGLGCRLDAAQLARLESELGRGPGAHGFADQRWTLARVRQLVRRLFRVDYTERGVSYLLHRMGWSRQVPVHRAVERDDTEIEMWKRRVWPRVKGSRRTSAPGSASPTRPPRR